MNRDRAIINRLKILKADLEDTRDETIECMKTFTRQIGINSQYNAAVGPSSVACDSDWLNVSSVQSQSEVFSEPTNENLQSSDISSRDTERDHEGGDPSVSSATFGSNRSVSPIQSETERFCKTTTSALQH